ncbi:LysR family transcriptional regulator ArgP [Ruegeria marina]|uniref:LysR family transcriptional regulator, chromosome initiation inhibitor n=1 Tax=Ruegeria marina TaxID=639004 RepID=A0A1G7AUS4_9RHOB|nr:LysR family transcriptional regulator ArgP [Ruegeria marina]SDE18589.1 LysR family transcriptional regulator, chromosome initiation inhibitor [Ruegeria marina]
MQFDPQHLAALTTILRLGSFEAAASALSVTPSAISQRIRALEERTGLPLIHRGTPCTGTAAGLRLARHAEDVGLLEAQVSRDLALDQGPGPVRVRIAVNADSLATWFLEAMTGAEDVLFDLVIDDQDHSADWLRRGEVAAAITAHDKPVPGCDAHSLGALRYIATASPAFMQRWFAEGVTAEALARAPCLTFNAKDRLQQRWIEAQTGARLTPPCHYLPSSQGFVDAALAGIGWGMNPRALVSGQFDRGELVPLIPHRPLDVPLTWQVSRVLTPALTPLTRAVKQAAVLGLNPL